MIAVNAFFIVFFLSFDALHLLAMHSPLRSLSFWLNVIHEPMISKKQIEALEDPYTSYVRKVLTQRGVPRHKHSRAVADIVGLERVSVQQKFSGIRGWTRSQLVVLEKTFGRPDLVFSGATSNPNVGNGDRQWNAILKLSNIPQRCILQRGIEAESPGQEALAAINEQDGWIVIPGTKVQPDQTAFQVINMTALPAPRVAALDDLAEIPDGIAAFFSRHGIQVSPFSDIDSLLEVTRIQPFEAYILDWSLGIAVTSEPVIEYIRDVQKSDVPITILTGELRTHQTIGSDIARMVERYQVSVLEKPVMLEILAKSFYNTLFRVADDRTL